MSGGILEEIERETDYRECAIADGPYDSGVLRRWRQSRDKLKQFFGRPAPVDVLFANIERDGFKALMLSNVPLCYFLCALLESFSSENLFFYLEVEKFQAQCFGRPEDAKKNALQIYHAFVKVNSDFQVNIDLQTRKKTRQLIERVDPHCFDTAKDLIERALRLSFAPFVNSAMYAKMRKNLEDKTVPYDPETRENAVKMLAEFLDKQRLSERPDGSEYLREAARQNSRIRGMVHAFCRTRLFLDFFDNPIEHQQQQLE